MDANSQVEVTAKGLLISLDDARPFLDKIEAYANQITNGSRRTGILNAVASVRLVLGFVDDGGEPPPPSPDPEPDPNAVTTVDQLRAAISKENATVTLAPVIFNVGNSPLKIANGVKLIAGHPPLRDNEGKLTCSTKITTSGTKIITEGGSNVEISGIDISGATGSKSTDFQVGSGISRMGANLKVTQCAIHHCSNHALGGNESGMVVENCWFHHIGSDSWLGASGGACKSANSYTISSCLIEDITGNAAWIDVAGRNWVAHDNTIRRCTRSGLRYEHNQNAPGPAHIYNNTITNCNTSDFNGAGGIAINSAPGALVENNTLGGNRGFGISFAGGRGPVSGGAARNNRLNGDKLLGCGSGVTCEGNQ